LTALAIIFLAGCSGGSHPISKRPAHTPSVTPSTLLGSDVWTLPAVPGPPSTANFCTLLTAVYRHEGLIPEAEPAVKVQIVDDYVSAVPEMIAEAPPSIAADANTYLTQTGKALGALAAAGLDYKKVPPGTFTALLLDPTVKSAGDAVLAFSQQQCHYTIGGA
jgi:hypothetical protein